MDNFELFDSHKSLTSDEKLQRRKDLNKDLDEINNYLSRLIIKHRLCSSDYKAGTVNDVALPVINFEHLVPEFTRETMSLRSLEAKVEQLQKDIKWLDEQRFYVHSANKLHKLLVQDDGNVVVYNDQKIRLQITDYEYRKNYVQIGVEGFNQVLEGTSDIRRPIRFSPSYVNVPEVVLALKSSDVENNHNFRFDLRAENITNEGFELVFNTWADTKIYSMQAIWIAEGKDIR